MADTALDQLQTAIKRQWSRVPSQKAKPYVNAFTATVRSGTKITAKIAIIVGILILIAPRFLNYFVAIYLIVTGLLGLGVLR